MIIYKDLLSGASCWGFEDILHLSAVLCLHLEAAKAVCIKKARPL